METKGRLSAVLLWLFLSCSVWGQLNIGPSTGPRPATPVSYQSGSSPTQPNAPTALGNSQPPSNLGPVTNSNLPPSGASLAPVASDRTLLTVEGIVARQTQLQSTNEIDPNLKQALGQLYESILAELRAKAETERLTKELAASAEALQRLRRSTEEERELTCQRSRRRATRFLDSGRVAQGTPSLASQSTSCRRSTHSH